MTRDEKIAAIKSAIQTDANLMILLKMLVTANIINVEDARLDMILQALGISNGSN